MIKDRILIIDGYNLFTRHYVAHPGMSENGDQIGGLVGFFNNMTRLITRTRPEHCFVIWESGGSKRKRDLYKGYKQGSRPQKLNRYYDDIPDTMENRNYQIVSLIKLLSFCPITQLYIQDGEADDVIGYLCRYKFKSKKKIIVSSDHDYYQLVGDDTIIWSPTLKSFVNSKTVIERYGVHPTNFCLAKSIVGDKSDNIPGVPRVGFKSLSKEYGAILLAEDVSGDAYQQIIKKNSEMLERSKKIIFKNIDDNNDLIRRNYKLVNLDVQNLTQYQLQKINHNLENLSCTWNNIEAHRLLNKLGIKSIDLLSCNHIFRLPKQQGKNE